MSNDLMEEGAERYNVPALERGLRMLCEFSRESRTLSAPELARRFDLPRSTVFRLLSTLWKFHLPHRPVRKDDA